MIAEFEPWTFESKGIETSDYYAITNSATTARSVGKALVFVIPCSGKKSVSLNLHFLATSSIFYLQFFLTFSQLQKRDQICLTFSLKLEQNNAILKLLSRIQQRSELSSNNFMKADAHESTKILFNFAIILISNQKQSKTKRIQQKEQNIFLRAEIKLLMSIKIYHGEAFCISLLPIFHFKFNNTIEFKNFIWKIISFTGN